MSTEGVLVRTDGTMALSTLAEFNRLSLTGFAEGTVIDSSTDHIVMFYIALCEQKEGNPIGVNPVATRVWCKAFGTTYDIYGDVLFVAEDDSGAVKPADIDAFAKWVDAPLLAQDEGTRQDPDVIWGGGVSACGSECIPDFFVS